MDIKKIFDKAQDRELAFMYIIKKVSETPLKKDRLKISSDLINYMQEEKQPKKYKVFNSTCVDCGSTTDPENGLCDNCD